MKTRSCKILAWGITVAGLIQSAQCRAADGESAKETSARNRKINEIMEASVNWYELLPNAGASTPLTPQVAIRWINASRGRDAQDFILLWVHDGRPVAAASVFPFGRDLCHELCSLSREAGLAARDRNGPVWAPESAGVKFHDTPDAPAPAGTLTLRLAQMKSMAARFTATLTGWKDEESDREVLRLLPRPLYRYDIKAAAATHPDLRDGAMFAFVQGTDPEVLLLIEEVMLEDRPRWQYAFASATSGALERAWENNWFGRSRDPRTKRHEPIRKSQSGVHSKFRRPGGLQPVEKGDSPNTVRPDICGAGAGYGGMRRPELPKWRGPDRLAFREIVGIESRGPERGCASGSRTRDGE